MKKRILITTESLDIGGVETTLLSLIKELQNYDVEIDLYVLRKGALQKEFEKLNKINIIPVQYSKNPLIIRILKNIKCKSLLKKYQKVNTKEYDIAIAYYGINNYSDLYAAQAKAKEKLIWVHCNFNDLYQASNHKFLIKIRNKLIAKKFNYFNQIIAVSESAKDGFLKIFPKYKDKISVINNIFSMERLASKNEDCEIEIQGENNLIYIGRLDKLKNVSTLLLEFQKVREVIDNAKLYIVGSGPEEENLKKIVCDLELQNKVVFLGFQNNPFKYLNKAALSVTASLSETYATNIIESLALKKYFVSANNSGAKDIFYNRNKTNLNNGIICDPEDMHYHIIYYLQHKNEFNPNFDIHKANDEIIEKVKKILKLQ